MSSAVMPTCRWASLKPGTMTPSPKSTCSQPAKRRSSSVTVPVATTRPASTASASGRPAAIVTTRRAR